MKITEIKEKIENQFDVEIKLSEEENDGIALDLIRVNPLSQGQEHL